MIKCVVFDIGNTLISKNGNNLIDPVLESDIERLREQGFLVGVASMRTFSLSKKLLKNIEFDFYICLSGAQIYIKDTLHYNQPLKNNTIKHSCIVYYSEKETYALDERCAAKARDKGFVVEKIKSNHFDPLYNIALIGIGKKDIEQYKKEYHTEYWSKIRVLVLQHKSSSKSNAIDFISDYYKIKKSEILGFGDGPNDIEFLSNCGTSVAMGHDYKELVDLTTYSTENESNLGVSKALRKLELIKDTIVLFIESLDEIGGMEIHGRYFIEYYKHISNLYVVTHKDGLNILVFMQNNWTNQYIKDIDYFIKNLDSSNTMLFFNSGHWIGEMQKIKSNIKHSVIFFRTGGNDIVSAPPFDNNQNALYRINYWRNTIKRCVDFLITNSHLTETRLLNFGIKTNIFRRVVGGVDLKKIRSYKKNAIKIKEELFFDSKKINLVSVSRFEPYKRVELLLRTFTYLDKHLFHLFLIGDGPLYVEIYSKHRNLENVTFLGKLDHDRSLKYICSGDFYIQFSGDTYTDLFGVTYIHTEGMGRTILESITAGTPIIATKCGAFSEIIHPKNGVLIDSDNPIELAEEIKRITSIKFEEDINESYDFCNVFNEYLRIWRTHG